MPLGACEDLVLSKFLVLEHGDRTSFRSIGVLVRVHRNRGDPWNFEIVFVGKLIAELVGERVDVAAEAAVRVAPNFILHGQFSNFGDRVVVSEGVFGCGCNQTNGV